MRGCSAGREGGLPPPSRDASTAASRANARTACDRYTGGDTAPACAAAGRRAAVATDCRTSARQARTMLRLALPKQAPCRVPIYPARVAGLRPFSTTSGGGVSAPSSPPVPLPSVRRRSPPVSSTLRCSPSPAARPCDTLLPDPSLVTRWQITRLHTDHPNMSQTVIHGDTVYLAGQVPTDYGGDIKQQTEETLAKIDALLEEAGTDKSNILQAQIWIREMEKFAPMNEVRQQPYSASAAALSCS